MKNRSTATVTWMKYNNFGTFLQAYALQQFIVSLGYTNHILDDSAVISLPLHVSGSLYKLKCFAHSIISAWSPTQRMFKQAQQETNTLYACFAEQHLKIDHVSAIKQTEADSYYDQYICGSDQIWCPTIEEHLNPYYYVNFTHKKKIAYAASFGVNTYPENRMDEFKSLAGSFAAISCREKIGCGFVREILGKETIHVSDPTLLLSDTAWRQISDTSIYKATRERYMLAYFLSPNSWYVDFSRRYASKHGLKLKTFFLRPTSIREADEAVVAGPADFIWLIDHADILFTDSFHGSIFATLMQTPFVGFQRFPSENNGQNHRLMDLYRLMQIESHYITDKRDCDRVKDLPPMLFSLMNIRLAPFIEQSKRYLSNTLAI